MNEFVAALLTMAAEERLKAESLRNLIHPDDAWWQHFYVYREIIAGQADEAAGRAEVYERFARALTYPEAWSDPVAAQRDELRRLADERQPDPELVGEIVPLDFFNTAWARRFFDAELLKPLPFEFAAERPFWSEHWWLHYYRTEPLTNFKFILEGGI